MPLGRLYGIGLGPGDPALLTLRALELLKSCARVFEVGSGNGADSVSGSILDGAGIEKAKRVPLEFSMAREKAAWQAKIDANAAVVAESLRLGEDCAFASIGDPLIYSTFSYLMKAVLALLPELEVEVVPGITSFQAAAAKARVPLVEDEESLLLAPMRGERRVEEAFASKAAALALLKAYKTKNSIVAHAGACGAAEIVYASRLGLDGELVTRDLDEAAAAPETYLSLFIVKRGMASK